MKQNKAKMLREQLPEIQAMLEKNISHDNIRKHMETKLGISISVGTFYSVIRVANKDESVKEEEVIRLSPEKLEILNDTGTVHIIHGNKPYRIESKKWCCKKLEKYGRKRGKIVAKFNICPFCSTKR